MMRLLLLVFAMLPFVCRAGERQYVFRSFDSDDGLAHNTVLAIIQDRTGFMWFGTKDGLNRYDGIEIRTVAVDDAIPGNNYITALCEDMRGRIWIGTDAGVCIYDPATERAERFLQRADDGSRIEGTISQIAMSHDGAVWIPAGQQGFFRFDPGDGSLTRIAGDEAGTCRYAAGRICFTAQNVACVALDDGNIYLSDDSLRSVRPLFADGGVEAFRNRFVNRMVAWSYNRILVCSFRGLFEVNLATGRFRKIDLPHSNDYVRDIIAVRNDEVWVATEFGLEILDGNLREIATLYADNSNAYMLQDNSIYCLCKDSDGDIWAGTYFAGIAYSRAGSAMAFMRRYAHADGPGLGRNVREIAADEDSDLWIGTESKGLFRYSVRTGETLSVSLMDSLLPSGEIRYNNIHGICCDGDYVWVGTYEQNSSLFRVHRRTLDAKSYPSAGKEIYTVCKTAGGDLLLGTTSGLRRYDPAADRFVADSVIGSHIHHIKEDSAGNLWAATYCDGLYRCDALEKTWRHFLYDESDTTSLAANKVLSVFEDSRLGVWFTTEGGGLCRYDDAGERFIRYRGVLPFDSCYRIEEDSQGLFWITSNKGLLRFDPEKLTYSVFTADDGLLNTQFNYSSLCKTGDGRIHAGSIDGFVSFDPAELNPCDGVFPVVLTDFTLYDEGFVAGDDSPLTKSITLLDSVELAPDENTFSLRVVAINYQSPHETMLRYRLEGFDSSWHRVVNNTISYSNLPYRTYRLVVEGLRADGEPNGAVRTLEIRIRPPFYCSGVAYALYAVLFLAAILLLYTIANRRALRKRAEELERFERRKERELYVAKFDFFTDIAHEIRTPLSLIRGPLEDLAERARRSLDAEAREDIETMVRNTDRMTTLINQLLDFRKVEQHGFRLKPVECDVTDVVGGVCVRFVSHARRKHIDFKYSLPTEPLLAAVDKEALTKIVSNLLANAMKYSERKASLSMSVDDDGGHFRVTVENDGPVVPADMRVRIFQPFMQYRDGKHLIAGTGIGLTLARSLVSLHGGTLAMDDDTTVNRFVMTVPVVHVDTVDRPVAGADAENDAEESCPAACGTSGRKSILIVEDDPEMRSFVARHLAPLYDTTTAENGLAASECLARNRTFDLIISDVMMPGMDGLELCRRVKGDLRYSHIPVLMLTAKTDVASKVEGVGAGADSYVEKPFSLEYLRASIATLLSNRELVQRHFFESPLVKSETLVCSKADEEFMRKLDEYIMQHLEQTDLSVDDMADAMCMSSSNLFRKLKAIIGKNPNEYLRVKRLKRAAELLCEGRYSIADIAIIVGFRSATYFSTCFKKQFGISPMDFGGGGGDSEPRGAQR
ncbi:MAG: response regulator [Alistipes sp.]|nr:response regulator [Alistipes sp.]